MCGRPALSEVEFGQRRDTARAVGMDVLPFDIKLVVLDHVLSLTELGSLRLCCSAWYAVVDAKTVQRWLRLHPVGVSTKPFTCAELGLAAGLLSVGDSARDRQDVVSLTCEVRPDGGVAWWLTNESGLGPPLCGNTSCASCVSGSVHGWALARSYLIVKMWRTDAQGCSVFFGRMCLDRLSLFARKALPAALRHISDVKQYGDNTERAFRAMSIGGWSSGAKDCSCCTGTTYVCTKCVPLEWEVAENEWIRSNNFWKAAPYGLQDWFLGASDGVGVVNNTGRVWLRCALQDNGL